jgi:hypothetical protein
MNQALPWAEKHGRLSVGNEFSPQLLELGICSSGNLVVT